MNSVPERLARIEEIALRIELKLDTHIAEDKEVELRVRRLEAFRSWVKGGFAALVAAASFLSAHIFHK